jgi:hypothetical protein
MRLRLFRALNARGLAADRVELRGDGADVVVSSGAVRAVIRARGHAGGKGGLPGALGFAEADVYGPGGALLRRVVRDGNGFGPRGQETFLAEAGLLDGGWR